MINVPGLSNKNTSPGAPAPVTFGMQNGLMDSASSTPGAGAMGYYDGSGAFGTPNAGPAQAVAGPAIVAANSDVKGMGNAYATNLSPVTVNAYAPQLGSVDPFFGVSPGSQFGIDPSGVQLGVTNLAPVKVAAQPTVTPSWWDTVNMTANDHKFAAQALGSAIPTLGTVFSVAHTLWNAQHGISPLQAFNPLGGAITHLFSGMGDGGGLGTASPDTKALNSLLYPPAQGPASPYGDGASTGVTGPSIQSSGSLPNYPGLGSLAGFGNALVGGYWNRQALKMASPAYGPYAGYGGGTPQTINYANPYAPSGITTAGY